MALDLTTLLSLAVVLVTTLLVIKYGGKRRRYVAMVNKIPGPDYWPIIGNALDVMVPRNKLMEMVDQRARKYAPIFRTWGGPEAHIHLTKAEHIELFLGNMKHIAKASMYRFLHPWLGQSLLTSAGDRWHVKRKMITPTFHFKILETFFDVFVEKTQILVEKLGQEATRKKGEAFDVYPFISRCNLDIICESAMGTVINVQEEVHSEYAEAVHNMTELTITRFFRPWLHPDFTFYRSALGKKYQEYLTILHGFSNKVIQERRKERLAESKEEKIEELLVMGAKKRLAFLDLLFEASEAEHMTDEDLRGEVDTFMFAGHDSTTTAISWALFLLATHEDAQDKAREEMDAIFGGSDRPVTMRDLTEMKYLERVIKEALRLYPSVPFIMRTIEEDTPCGEYVVPAGSMINVHIFHVHRDPKHFPSPEKFNPDHFLPERVQGRHPYAYIPFSAGPRNCIGQKFAMMEEKTVIAAVLRRFTLQAIEKVEELTLLNELILRPESGVRLVLTPR